MKFLLIFYFIAQLIVLLGCEKSETNPKPKIIPDTWKIKSIEIDEVIADGNLLKNGGTFFLESPIQFKSSHENADFQLKSLSQCWRGEKHLGSFESIQTKVSRGFNFLQLIQPEWTLTPNGELAEDIVQCNFNWTLINSLGSKHFFEFKNVQLNTKESVGGLKVSHLSEFDTGHQLISPNGVVRSKYGSKLKVLCKGFEFQDPEWSGSSNINQLLHQKTLQAHEIGKFLYGKKFHTCRAFEIKNNLAVSATRQFAIFPNIPSIHFSVSSIELDDPRNRVSRRHFHNFSYYFLRLTIRNPLAIGVPIKIEKPRNNTFALRTDWRNMTNFNSRPVQVQWDVDPRQIKMESDTHWIIELNPAQEINGFFNSENYLSCSRGMLNGPQRMALRRTIQPLRKIWIDQLDNINQKNLIRRMTYLDRHQTYCYGPVIFPNRELFRSLTQTQHNCAGVQNEFSQSQIERECMVYYGNN